MTDQLRRALDAVASEVEQVDLRDRVYRTSRRLGMRRATAAGTCAALLLGGTVLTTARVFASAEEDGPIGAAEASSSCVPADAREPWTDPSDYATLTPEPSIGELFYLERAPAAGAATVRLVSWQPGMPAPAARCELPAEAVRNANVSPDGKWITWVTSDSALHIADLSGEVVDRTLRRGVDAERVAPVWSPDGRQLIIRDVPTGRVGVVDMANGRFTRLRRDLPDVRSLAWASDGSAIGFVTSDGAVIVAEPDGSRQRRVPNLDKLPEPGGKVVAIQGLSGARDRIYDTGPPSGEEYRWLTVWVGDGGTRSLPRGSNAMINTREGKKTAVIGGVTDYTPFQVFFRNEPGQGPLSHLLRRPEGRRAVELIGGNGEYWGGGEEPEELAGFVLLNG